MYSFSGLEGKRVKLVPLELEHVEPLYNCSRNPEIWANYPVRIESLEEMNHFVSKAIEGRDRGEQYPFAVFDKEYQEYIGTTRYLRISEENNNLNIGSTWYSDKVWRTRVNTESKYLLLKYAFETLKTVRVEIITTTENVRSQKAIERIGAIREGVLRKKFYNMNFIIYSILDEEWSHVRERLEGFLDDERRVKEK